MAKQKKKKKKKQHRVFWFFIKLQIFLMVLILGGLCFYLLWRLCRQGCEASLRGGRARAEI